MLSNCAGKGSWESFGLQGDLKEINPKYLLEGRRSVLGVHWRDWCWSWISNTLATSCEELTHLKRPWCWERLRVGGEGDDRGWHGWMTSPTQWTWVWVDSGSWRWTGRPGVLWFMGSQRHDWATELNWTEAEVLIRWPPDAKSWLTEKVLMRGKIEGTRRRGQERMRWLNSITNSMDINLSKFQETVKDMEVWHAAVHGLQRVRHDWATEQQPFTITAPIVCF